MSPGAAVAFLEEQARQLGLGCQKVEVSLGPLTLGGGGPAGWEVTPCRSPTQPLLPGGTWLCGDCADLVGHQPSPLIYLAQLPHGCGASLRGVYGLGHSTGLGPQGVHGGEASTAPKQPSFVPDQAWFWTRRWGWQSVASSVPSPPHLSLQPTSHWTPLPIPAKGTLESRPL